MVFLFLSPSNLLIRYYKGNSVAKPFGPEASAVLKKSVGDQEIGTNNRETATFAAGIKNPKSFCRHYVFNVLCVGCFWGVELSFQRVPGVMSTEVCYII